jgi:hypothetical protein
MSLLYIKMTHLSSTSVALSRVSSSLPNKARRRYHSLKYLSIIVECTGVHLTQVHTKITITRLSYIDYSYEFLGSLLARFERSTLPDHKGKRTVVLRFLKIITPVKRVIPLYDDYVCCPKEGELHRRRTGNFKNHQVWSVNIDTPLTKNQTHMQRGLQLLWDV